MFLFGVGVGLVAAFVVMTVAACVGARLVVQVDSERLDSEPLPQLGPSLLLDLSVDPADEQAAKAVSRVHRALEERNKYRSALEAISTMNQDGSSQRSIRTWPTPDGWEAVLVRSPWPGRRCPHCGEVLVGANAAVGVLTKRLHRARVLLFSLTPVCGECVTMPNRLAVLAMKTFE